VVGSADTGCQIAEELLQSGRKVYLCVGRAGRRPRRYRGRDIVFWSEALGRSDQTVDEVSLPSARYAANPQATGKNGGYTLNLHHLAINGIMLLGRLIGVSDGIIHCASDLEKNMAMADKASEDFKREVDAFIVATGLDAPQPEPDPIDEARSEAGRDSPTTLDLKSAGISTVIWANGYSHDFSSVHFPVVDDLGFPLQRRGITRFPGLYFVGMNLLYNHIAGTVDG
jgi:putative flavoprotein involved in K+ transport